MTEWISVKFALPVDCRQILVTNGAFIGFTYFDVHDRKFEPTDGKYIDIFDPKCDYQIECLPESITHWAQLPEPPKES